MDEDFAKFKALMDNIKFNINPNQDIKAIEAKIIQKIPQQTLPNQFYYVINNQTKECIYVSDSITDVTGYTPDEWTYKCILEYIHPNDKPFIDRALYACFKYCMSPVINLPITDAMTVNYRIKHKDGHYIHILRNGYCTSMDTDNRMVHNTSMCMDISDIKHNNTQSMILQDREKVVVELHSYDYINWAVLSNREQEIVELLCNNKTSEQIGQQLFISKHTVDTHRRKILTKLNLKNTTELLFRSINNK